MDLLFPPTCPVCESIRPLLLPGTCCNDCQDYLKPIQEPKCFKCGRSLRSTNVEYCSLCMSNNYPFNKGYSLYSYEGLAKSLILKLKYNGRGDLAEFFAREIYKLYKDEFDLIKPDLIIAVPIHSSRLIERGYNQAQLIADNLSKLINVPTDDQLLLRNKETKALKQLGKYSRIINLYDAFSINYSHYDLIKNKNSLKTALLVDDIYTSGSTISTCAQYLREIGFDKIYFITVCSTNVE